MIKTKIELWLNITNLKHTVFRPACTEVLFTITLYSHFSPEHTMIRDRLRRYAYNLKELESEMRTAIRKYSCKDGGKYKSLIGEDFE